MKVSWPRSWDMDLTFHASAKDVVSHYEQVGHPRLALRLFDANGRRLEFVTDGKTWPPWRTHRGTSQAVRLRKHNPDGSDELSELLWNWLCDMDAIRGEINGLDLRLSFARDHYEEIHGPI